MYLKVEFKSVNQNIIQYYLQNHKGSLMQEP